MMASGVKVGALSPDEKRVVVLTAFDVSWHDVSE